MSRYMSVLNADDAATFQTTLNIISDWAQHWQLGILVNKCSVLNIGKMYSVLIIISVIVFCLMTRPVVILVFYSLMSDLSPYVHIGEIVRKGHQRANAILRCFVTCDNAVLVRAFITYVRPLQAV